MNPKVSIIMPAYNAEDYITKAIQSALDQTEPNIEVIVINDASTDHTVDVVQGFSDSRVKLFRNESNSGASFSRNRGIKEATGEWVVPLDSDDWYAPERIEKLLQVAEKENADLVADDLHFVQDESETLQGTLFCVAQQDFNQIREIDLITLISLNMKPARISPHLGLTKPLMKREFLLKNGLEYDCRVPPIEDFLLYGMCLLKGGRFIVIPEAYYYYRRSRPGSASTQRKLKVLDRMRQANLFLLEQKEVDQVPNLRKLINQYISQIDQDLDYNRITQLLREKSLPVAIQEILTDFELLKLTVQQVPRLIQHQFSKN